MPKLKKRRGSQPNNQNARKHGFYSQVLTEAEQIDLDLAEAAEGIDAEIALLRVKIKAILEKDPDNIRLIMDATNTLARLMRTHYLLTKDQKKGLKEAITNVLTDIAIPLGVGAVRTLSK